MLPKFPEDDLDVLSQAYLENTLDIGKDDVPEAARNLTGMFGTLLRIRERTYSNDASKSA